MQNKSNGEPSNIKWRRATHANAEANSASATGTRVACFLADWPDPDRQELQKTLEAM